MNKMIQMKAMSCLWILLAMLGVGEASAQSAIDYSSLSDENPAGTLSQTENYKEALSDGTWQSLNTVKATSEWKALYANDCFVQSFNTLGAKPYESALVSPALKLADVSGHTLSFDWTASTVKGDIHLKALVIDKNGTTLAELGDMAGVAGSTASQWSHVSVTLPALSGTGYISFYTAGDKANRASFRVRNINTVAGQMPVTITVTPDAVDFGTVTVGETSYAKTVNALISNYDGTPTAKVTAGDASDFVIANSPLASTGGGIQVYFVPTSAGTKTATLTVTAGDQTAEATLTGIGEGQVATGPTVELLTDPYFYSFTGNKPKVWETKGTTTKLEGSDRYSSDTGFGLGMKTEAESGYVKETIDLGAEGKTVGAGDELECLIHYSTMASRKPSGPFRLALRWLNEDGTELESAEKDFINNPNLYFGRALAYGELKFRTICPAGATKLEFAVEVAPYSEVRFDDFSVLRLSEEDKKPLVAIIPQFRTIYGEVGVTETYPIAIQGMHLNGNKQPKFGGTSAEQVLSIDIPELPKNGTVAATLSVKPVQKGAFTMGNNAYSLTFDGAAAENTGRLTLTSYFKAAGTTPTIAKAEGSEVKIMKAEPGKTDQQTIELKVTDVINSVTVVMEQETNRTFITNTSLLYYSPTSDKILNNTVRIDFKPTAVGKYHGTLVLSTQLADTLRIPIEGVCEKTTGAGLVEKFSADNKMDDRFTGPAWNGFHKFDQGYWKLDGKWNGKNSVTLDKGGELYFDEVLANGIASVAVAPAANAMSLTLEYSIDGGGHWTKAGVADGEGSFPITDNHRPTYFRLVNHSDAAVDLNTVTIVPNLEADREKFNNIASAMIPSADEEALSLLNMTFTGLRHTRTLGIAGWQNLMLRGERPFYAWHQKKADQKTVENECAQISFLHYGFTDDRPHESWLVSPTLSYKNAASKTLTFSLRFQNVTEDTGEQFGFYIITEKDGQVKEQYLDLTDYVTPGVTVEADKWFDYHIDLSSIESIQIDDKFHVAFSYYSPKGGNTTILNFMIDDVTFGRTDLPKLSVDQTMVNIPFQAGLSAEPKVINVVAERATSPITLTLVPSSMNTFFKVAGDALTLSGGPVGIGYKSDDSSTRAAMLLVQTRGAAPVAVKLLATQITNGIDNVQPDESKPVVEDYYTIDGRRLNKPVKGIMIVRTADGRIRKEVVK